MQINCPVCSTAIEVNEEHAGHKGRCISCSTKFIIPSSFDQEIQILELGEKPEPAVAPSQNNSPPVLKMPAAPAYTPPKPVVIKKSGSPMGLLVLVVLIAVCGVGFYLVKSGKMIQISNGDANANKTVVTKKIIVQSSGKKETDEKQSADGKQSTDLDENVPFKLPGSIDDNFEITEENKSRALAFLMSGEIRKRESVYDAFRELGERFKETYEQLLVKARTERLSELEKEITQLSDSEQISDALENDFQSWKDAANNGLKLAMTKWKEKDPTGYKQKVLETNEAVKRAEELYLVLSEAFEGKQFDNNDSLKGFVVLFNELDSEIAWSKGEDSTLELKLSNIIEEINNKKEKVNGGDGAGDDLKSIKIFVESNRAILNFNEQVNWGTSLYKKLLLEINQKRIALGFNALKINEQLTTASEMHSGDMHFQEFFSHKSFDGAGYADRAKRAGFEGKVFGEFLYRASPDPISAFNYWWTVDSQRIMMLNKETDTIGVGRAENYWTVNIGKLAD